MSQPFILTQMPTSLIESPLMTGQYGYLDDGGLSQLQTDIEEGLGYLSPSDLSNRLLKLQLNYASPVQGFVLDLQDPIERLIAGINSSDLPRASLVWILQFGSSLLNLARLFNLELHGLYVREDTPGAYLVQRQPQISSGDDDCLPPAYRSEWLRHRLFEEMRRNL